MKALWSRTMFVALMVVTGSVVTGISLGLILTKAIRAGDKPRTTAKAPKVSRSRVSANRGVSPVDGPVAGNRNLSLGSGRSSPLAAQLGLKQIPFDPRTLRSYLKQVRPAPALGISPRPDSISSPTLPVWSYNVTAAQDGNSYSGLIVGRDPRNHAKVTTTLPTQIVPIIITIDNGSGDVHTYDPTKADLCNGTSAVGITSQSPLFNNNAWTMNGVNVGNTQYVDAFQRAEFWQFVQGSNYHLMLGGPQVLPTQTLTFGLNGTSGAGANLFLSQFNQGQVCSPLGEVFMSDLDQAIMNLITGPLAGQINPGTFPLFAMVNVVSADDQGNCCILGYHNAINNPTLQIYSPFNMDTAGYFGSGFTGALSHEIAEAMNDPNINNLTPVWGGIGQQPGCQNNLEVGDPLSPGGPIPPGTNPFNVLMNGRTYTLQELAYYSWFFGGPSVGTHAGDYSNNGTFKGFSKLCPPGGTN